MSPPAHRFTVTGDHPALAGHFPGRPIVPGVVLLAEVLDAVAVRTGMTAPWRLHRVKFMALLPPGEDVTVTLDASSSQRVGFTCSVAGRTIAVGTAEAPR